MNDLISLCLFSILMIVFGLSVWPLSYKIFKRFPDKGWTFSRTLASLIVGWLLWITTFTGIAKINTTWALSFEILVGCIVWGWAIKKKWYRELFSVSARKWIYTEIIFYAFWMGLWTWFRSNNPDISGLEKFMDFGFMKSIARGQTMPPLNHFLGGEVINYYYYGHYLAVLNSLITFTSLEKAYNLQMSYILALGFTHVFILAAFLLNWLKDRATSIFDSLSFFGGFIAAVFAMVMGNFQAVYALIMVPQRPYWYPNATRFIENTIHEFPIYSFLVNDLHGHVANIPNDLMSIALIMSLFLFLLNSTNLASLNSPKTFFRWLGCSEVTVFIALLTLSIGASYYTNAWDFPIYLLLSGSCVWWAFAQTIGTVQNKRYPVPPLLQPQVLIFTFAISVALVLFSILWYLPHWIVFHPISQGIAAVPAEKSSPTVQWLILWFVHGAPCLVFYRYLKSTNLYESSARQFIYIFLAIAFGLTLYPEFLYMKDIYPMHFRANTMFKFYYQAWIWSSIVAGVGLTLMLSVETVLSKVKFFLVSTLAIICIGSGLAYTIQGVRQQFIFSSTYPLEGREFLAKRLPDDLKTIDWIANNISGQGILLEAVGDGYTDYARMSTFTGLPAVLGWPIHVWLWNGSYDKSLVPKTHVELRSNTVDTVARRIEEVKTIYETLDVAKARALLNKYNVKYIYVGSLERTKYPLLSESKFYNLGKLIYQSGDSHLFEVTQ